MTGLLRVFSLGFGLQNNNSGGGGGDTTAPTITSANPSGSYVEGVAISGTLTASEPATFGVTGTDAAAVTLDTGTGVWSLEDTVFATKAAYSFTFTATDAANNVGSQVVAIAIAEATGASAPTITSSATGSAIENEDYTQVLTASEDSTWAIVGGADQAAFTLTDNQLTLAAHDADVAGDADGNNIYAVQVRATSTATGLTADQSLAITLEPVAPTVDTVNKSTNGTGFTSVTTTTATAAHVIPQAANRILVVMVGWQDQTDSTNGLVGVTWDNGSGAVALTKMQEPGYSTDFYMNGTRGADVAIYYLLAPGVGSGTVTVTRTGVGSARPAIQCMNLSNMAQQAPTAVSRVTSATTTAPVDDSLTVPGPDQLDIFFTFVEITNSAQTVGLESGWTAHNIQAGNGTTQFYAVSAYREEPTALTRTAKITISTLPAVRYTHAMMCSFKALPFRSVDPIYYVDPAGSDTNDGLSDATAFASIDKIAALSPLPAGAEIYLKRGATHRSSSAFNPANDLVALSGTGTSSAHIKFDAYGTGADPIIAGDQLHSTGWGTTTAGSSFLQANGQENTLGAGYEFCNFPLIDGKMHHPAIWCASGHPSSIRAWDDNAKGSDSYTWPASADIQAGGTTVADDTKAVKWSKSGSTYTITIADPAIAAHYGSDSPAGRIVAWRQSVNQTQWTTIASYDQTASSITFTDTIEPHQSFFWAILFHPLDVVQAGQYGWNGDPQNGVSSTKMYVAWLSGTTKSISRWVKGVRLTGSYWDIANISFQATSGHQGLGSGPDNASMLELALANSTLDHIDFAQAINDGRSRCLGVMDNASSNLTMTNFTFDKVKTHSAFRLAKLTGGSIDTVTARRLGRTIIYLAGTTSGVTITNVDAAEHLAIHGNGASAYQGANGNTVDKFLLTGNAQPVTSQTVNAAPIPASKAMTWERGFITQGRPVEATAGVDYSRDGSTPAIRLDGGDTNSLFKQLVVPLATTSGVFVGMGTTDSENSSGMTFDRLVAQGIAFDSDVNTAAQKSGFGVVLNDVLATSSPFLGAMTDWTAAGATVNRSEVDTGQTWAGCLTSKEHEYLTRADGGGGSGGSHTAVQIGPDSYGWVIPAYPTVDALVDVVLTTSDVPRNYQAGKTVGTIVKTRPGSTLSLGGTDAASFILDRGVLVAAETLSSASYSITITETNASAPNGPTRTTTLTVTTSI